MKRLKYLSTLLVAAVALIAAWLLWNFYTQSPWTRDGKVRAEQVGITPQVSGSILQLNVTDNQRVKAGEVLFTIDDTPYRIAVLNAQAQLKHLHGIIPICAACKKIRDDEGSWHQLESYIRDHSEAKFSHGICPECQEAIYGDTLRLRR